MKNLILLLFFSSIAGPAKVAAVASFHVGCNAKMYDNYSGASKHSQRVFKARHRKTGGFFRSFFKKNTEHKEPGIKNQREYKYGRPGLVCAILSLLGLIIGVGSNITGLLIFGMLCGLCAVLFGIIALVKREKKGLAVVSIVLGQLFALINFYALALILYAFD